MFEYFNGRDRKTNRAMAAKNNAKLIGVKLSVGMGILSALETVAIEAHKQDRAAFSAAVQRLKSGAAVGEAIKDRMLNLLPRDKYVLSLDIPDQAKGEILMSWSEPDNNLASNLGQHYLIVTLGIFAMSMVNVFEFVVPQFHDICLGGGLLETMPKWVTWLGSIFHELYRSKLYFLLPFVSFGILLLIMYLISDCFNIKKLSEEADLLNLISKVDREQQWKFIDHLSNKICFPKSFNAFKRLSLAMTAEGIAEKNIGNSGVSPYMAWLLQLSLQDNNREFLRDGAILLREKVKLDQIMLSRVSELAVAIFNGLFYLFLALYMSGTINAIMTGNIML